MNPLLLALACLLTIHQVVSQANITRINNGDLYWYCDGVYNGLFMITPKGVIVVDGPPSFAGTGKTLPEVIAGYTDQPIKWVIYSHHHLDHIGASNLYPKNAEVICQKKAAKYISARKGAPPCTTLVSDSYELKVDKDHVIQLDYRGTIHTEGNLYIYVPKDKLLMLVDFVFPQWGPYHSWGMQASLAKYWQAFENVLAYDFEHYVGGHVDRMGTPKDVQVAKDLFDDVQASMKQAVTTVDQNAIVQENGGYNGKNSFTIFRAYTDALVDECVRLVLKEKGWENKLIDASAYMDTHCFLMYEYIGVDY